MVGHHLVHHGCIRGLPLVLVVQNPLGFARSIRGGAAMNLVHFGSASQVPLQHHAVLLLRGSSEDAVEHLVEHTFRGEPLVPHLPATLRGREPPLRAPAVAAVQQVLFGSTCGLELPMVMAGLVQDLIQPSSSVRLHATPRGLVSGNDVHRGLHPEFLREVAVVAIDDHVHGPGPTPDLEAGEQLAVRVHHLLALRQPGLRDRLGVLGAEGAVCHVDLLRPGEGLHLEGGHDAWKVATAASGHPPHVGVLIDVRDFYFASGIHILNHEQAIASQPMQLRGQASTTAQDEARRAHAAHRSTLHQKAVSIQLVVELTQAMACAKRGLVRGPVQLERLQVLQVDHDAARAAGIVLVAVPAAASANLQAGLRGAPHGRPHLGDALHTGDGPGVRLDVGAAVDALLGALERGAAWIDGRPGARAQAAEQIAPRGRGGEAERREAQGPSQRGSLTGPH
mmetsp:Transcript_128397/g.411566  ORF Transcript_128397/g.411566 Transcript_128397/m.411566 type:complete len:452 (+) Transcript_128397:2313-3668(+)